MAPCLPAMLLLCIYSSFAKEILKHIIGNVNILPIYNVNCRENNLTIDQYLQVERKGGGKWICWSRHNKKQSLSVQGL